MTAINQASSYSFTLASPDLPDQKYEEIANAVNCAQTRVSYRKPEVQRTSTQAIKELAGKGELFLCIDSLEGVVGTITIKHSEKSAMLSMLSAIKSGQGIGQFLLQQAENRVFTSSEAMESIGLIIFDLEDEKLKRFYRQEGYIEDEKNPPRPSNNLQYIDSIVKSECLPEGGSEKVMIITLKKTRTVWETSLMARSVDGV